MSYDEILANRVRSALSHLPNVEEKRMFRGITFMVDGKMCISVGHDELMCRIDPAMHEQALRRKGARAVMMRGREYRGFVYVGREGWETQQDFEAWIAMALVFNPRAQASRKRSARVPGGLQRQ